jgi:Fic family protein
MESKYCMTQAENIFFAKRNIVDYIWKSANLEGIGVTYPDTQAIYNGMAVSGYSIDDINAVNDLKHAWKFLLDTVNEELDLEYIKRLHRLVGRFTVINPGSLRLDVVGIGGTEWIPDMPDEKMAANRIHELLNENCSDFDKAINLMLYLMRAQLFYDGNKRLAMLAANKIMIKNGLGIISVTQKNIQEFYQLLIPYYETGNPENIKQFLYNNCIDGMKFT